MTNLTYVGDEGRVYPSFPAPANEPEVGVAYDLDVDPGDGRWAAQPARRKSTPAHDTDAQEG